MAAKGPPTVGNAPEGSKSGVRNRTLDTQSKRSCVQYSTGNATAAFPSYLSKNSRRPATSVRAAAVDRQPLAVSHRTASGENGGPLAHGQWLSEIGIPAAPFDDPEPLELSKDAEQRQLVAARCSTGTPATV